MKGSYKEKKKQRLGERSFNSFGTEMEIIQYNKSNDIIVMFLDEYKTKVHTIYQNFKDGNVRNPYDKTIFGVGYIGIGKYDIYDNCIKRRSYQTWQNMLKRCYDNKTQNKQSTYIGCVVCGEWHNYQNFAEWYDKNYYELDGCRMHLDKDILGNGCKIYSPETCIFVPQRINMLFVAKSKSCDCDLPTGITRTFLSDGTIKYNSMYNGKHIKTFDNLSDALYNYNLKKKEHIKQVADEYRDKIPTRLYKALIEWKP